MSDNGKLTRVAVRLGVTDGRRTAVYSDALTEGMQVLTSIATSPAAAPSSSSTSPLLPPMRGRGAGTGARGNQPAGR